MTATLPAIQLLLNHLDDIHLHPFSNTPPSLTLGCDYTGITEQGGGLYTTIGSRLTWAQPPASDYIVSPSNHTPRIPAKPATVGSISQDTPQLKDIADFVGEGRASGGNGTSSGQGRTKPTPATTLSDINDSAVSTVSPASATSPVGLFIWCFSGIMASALAYGWGGWFWQTAVKTDEQFGDVFVGDEINGALPRVAEALYGWDIKRLLFWSLVLIVFCIIGKSLSRTIINPGGQADIVLS